MCRSKYVVVFSLPSKIQSVLNIYDFRKPVAVSHTSLYSLLQGGTEANTLCIQHKKKTGFERMMGLLTFCFSLTPSFKVLLVRALEAL